MSKTINEPRKILLVMHRALGDSVFGLAALAYLRTVFPKAKVTYALPRWITGLYLESEIAADKVFPLELDSINGVWSFIQEIRREKYDVVIELQQSGRTRKILNFCKPLFGFRYIFHNHHQKKGDFIFEQGVRKAISQRHLDTCYSYVRTIKDDAPYPHYLDYLPRIKCLSSLGDASQIILGIVASKEEKKWPVEYFAQLIRKWASVHPSARFLVPVSNSPEDQLLADKFQKLTTDLSVEIVNLPLNKLLQRMSGSEFYIGNDTGLKHIAAALGAKTLTFFGPEEPLEWHPYALDRHIYFWVHGHDVRTKMSQLCLLKQFDHSVKLKEISVEEVMDSLKGWQ